ncbi:PucR family transcriptional regulator ligand-binding domain-containing protein [Embleya sp. NPDC020630]|uniref:helix-turn-helix domain-containing protein n=1 Tax=Embleya sp. NPDC020630 TaxID=3363979 RepID=UPI0037A42E35
MTLSLRAVLDHPLMRGADPAVPDPHADLDRPVRWVHSSEIYEIAPLLRGDELLLTTGLGLAGRDAGERRRYVTELAAAGVAGVALEVGRTFREVPDDVVRAAADAGLPLVVLRGVVPFVEIAEAVNAAILDSAVTRLRHVNRIVRTLSGVLARGAGVEELTTTLSSLTNRPVVLAALDGTPTAYAGTDDPTSVARTPTAEAGVELRGALWGRLLLGTTTATATPPPGVVGDAADADTANTATGATRTAGTTGTTDANPSPGAAGAANPDTANPTTSATRTAGRAVTAGAATPTTAPADGLWSTAGAAIAREVAEHAAQVFAPALLRLADRGGWVGRERRELVEGLLGDALPPREVAARLTVCGLVPAGTAVWATIALNRPDPVQAVTTLYEGLRACGGRGLVSDGPGGAYALIALDRPTHIAELADRLGLPGATGHEPTAALGPLVRDVARVGHSLRAARDTLRLARRVHPIRPTGVAETVLADDWALERLLDGLPPEELADLVEDQLGPLLAADATRGTGLVDTLEAYLRCGCSKTETAGVLFLRRQSVHQRLALIESLLHVSPDAPDRQGPLRAALTARDLLTTRGPNPT